MRAAPSLDFARDERCDCLTVTPAQAGAQTTIAIDPDSATPATIGMDPSLRWDDEFRSLSSSS